MAGARSEPSERRHATKPRPHDPRPIECAGSSWVLSKYRYNGAGTQVWKSVYTDAASAMVCGAGAFVGGQAHLNVTRFERSAMIVPPAATAYLFNEL